MKLKTVPDAPPAEPTLQCFGTLIGGHAPNVYLLRATCRDRSRSAFYDCAVCGARLFCRGPAWKRTGVSRDQAVLQAASIGLVAVDGRGQPL